MYVLKFTMNLRKHLRGLWINKTKIVRQVFGMVYGKVAKIVDPFRSETEEKYERT